MKSVLSCWIIVLLLGGCNAPPLYGTRAEKYLEGRGVDSQIIRKLTRRQPLTQSEIEDLWKFDHVPTLHLLAGNPGASTSVLKELSVHENKEVRWGVASNPSTPKDVLLGFRTKGTYSTMNTYLAANPAVPKDILRDMYRNDEALNVSFARNPNCPLELMESIAQSDREVDRAWMALNPRLPPSLMDTFEKDESKLVRDYLNRNPRYRSRSN